MKKLALLITLFCFPVLFAQNEAWNQRIQQLSFADAGGDYRLGPGDLIQVDVFGVENFRQNLRISSSGTITVPYLGNVQAAGLTTMQLEEALRGGLDEKYIKNPQVSVFVTEYRSQSVFVLGAVSQPGQYQITHAVRLIDAIGMAGGLNVETADDFAIIQKRGAISGPGSASPQPVQTAATENDSSSPTAGLPANGVRINLKDLLENGNLDLNVPIEGGDVIQVPERQMERFFIVGDVGRPGAYELPREEEVNVTQALAWAGGPLRTAKKDKGLLIRHNEQGERQEVAINVDDIFKGKKPDVQVRANDVIFLPGSTAKSIGYGLLGIIPGTVSSTVVWGTVRR
jgi:polysaccharide biosynthesis/export protein